MAEAKKITSEESLLYVTAWYLFNSGEADSADSVTFNRRLKRSPDDPDGDTGHPYCGDADTVAAAIADGVDDVRRMGENDPAWMDRVSLMITVGTDPETVNGSYDAMRGWKVREEQKREFAAAETARAAALEKALRELIAATASSRSAAVKSARSRATRAANKHGAK